MLTVFLTVKMLLFSREGSKKVGKVGPFWVFYEKIKTFFKMQILHLIRMVIHTGNYHENARFLV